MARFGNDQTDLGHLDIQTTESGQVEGFFIPSQLPSKEFPAHQRLEKGVKLVELDTKVDTLKIHPINTLPAHDKYLGPKYEQILTLTLKASSLESYYEGDDLNAILEILPGGFVKDFNYGLGAIRI